MELNDLFSLYKKQRPELEDLQLWMKEHAFDIAPASTSWHGNFRGGLSEHCFHIYQLYLEKKLEWNIDIPLDSIFLTAFGHDLCKVPLYVFREDGTIGYDKEWGLLNPGHSLVSLKILQEEIGLKLSELEVNMIKFHMGMYGTKEFGGRFAEYTMEQLGRAFEDKRVKLLYFCDDMASQFMARKVK